jgi:D-alanine-D-alanine ligase-like ATP-grasp enzyme
MKPLAVVRTNRVTGRAAPPRRDHRAIRLLDLRSGGGECGPPSRAFDENDAKDHEGGPHHDRSANLKPNIYYKAQDFAPGARRVPGCRGGSRVDRHLIGAASEESEPVGPGINARPAATETSSAPDRTANAGFWFYEPVAWMVEDVACDF